MALMPRLLLPFCPLLHCYGGQKIGILSITPSWRSVLTHGSGGTSCSKGWPNWGGCTALGWFFGFKFHLPINHHGQIMAFKITGDNPDARQPLEPRPLLYGGR